MFGGYGMYGGPTACPTCGYGMGYAPYWSGFTPGYGFGYGPGFGYGAWGLGGLRTWGGTYSPQFLSTGVPTDEEIEEMVYDAIDSDPIVPYDADINVEVSAGEVTLSGTVPNKRIKHAVGDDSWWVPGVTDVHNNLQVSGRRRARTAPREEAVPTPPSRQQRSAK